VDPDALDEQASRDLWAAYRRATRNWAGRDVTPYWVLAGLDRSHHAFFEAVLVMAEDEAVRRNRLALVYAVAPSPTGW